MARAFLPIFVAMTFAALILWWDRTELQGETPVLGPAVAVASKTPEPVQPLPRQVDLDPTLVALGARLFNDVRLSRDETISCASCHVLGLGGADGRAKPLGIDGSVGTINTPTVFNSGFGFRQYWDGRARTLEEQVDGPLESPGEMGSSWPLALDRIGSDGEYRAAFDREYPDGITRENVRHAISTFERSLITPDSPFDRFLRGDPEALSDAETRGYALFKQYGCIGCHQGMLLGGNMFQRLGIVRDYFEERGNVSEADFGRFNVTGNESDRHVFKVPSLRNVALTAPYFHDGTAATLPDAIRVMARFQLGREIPDGEVELIAGFLETLTGELRGSR